MVKGQNRVVTDFEKKVYAACKSIPAGFLINYPGMLLLKI
jgi:hypothetical protein